jgi:hypothetical protein
MGGEHSGFDIGNYPRVGKRIIFDRDRIQMLEEDGLTPLSFEQWLPEGLPEAYRGSAPKKEA